MLGYICDQCVLLERIGTSKNQGRSSGALKAFARCNRSIELNIHSINSTHHHSVANNIKTMDYISLVRVAR